MIRFPNAKINIGLHILRKREDGYHDLNAFFVPIKWNDVLEIIPSTDGIFNFKQSGISLDCPIDQNLCVKAYELLRSKYEIPSVHMQLLKNLPFGAGMGGGSSDASSVLLLLNQLFKLNIEDSELHKMALTLGADCPFFIYNKPSFVSGIGDEIQVLEKKILRKSYKLILLKPKVHISTAEAYKGVYISGDAFSIQTLMESELEDWKHFLRNDFEEHLFRTYPLLKELKVQLYNQGALYASMTGSGSALYGIFNNNTPIDRALFPDFVWEGQLDF